MPQPTTEHQVLADHAGKWNVVNKNERLFEMFCTVPDGTEVKMMPNHYRRA